MDFLGLKNIIERRKEIRNSLARKKRTVTSVAAPVQGSPEVIDMTNAPLPEINTAGYIHVEGAPEAEVESITVAETLPEAAEALPEAVESPKKKKKSKKKSENDA